MAESESPSESEASLLVEHATGLTSEPAQDAHGIYECRREEGGHLTRCVVSIIDGVTDGLCFHDGGKIHFHQNGYDAPVESNKPWPKEVKAAACMDYAPDKELKAENIKWAEENAKMDARKLASAPKASASSGGGSSGGVAGELHDLQAMHNDGTLSDAEFNAAKAKLLGTDPAPRAAGSVTQWHGKENCYHDDHAARRLSIGVAMTSRLAKKYGQRATQWLATQVRRTTNNNAQHASHSCKAQYNIFAIC